MPTSNNAGAARTVGIGLVLGIVGTWLIYGHVVALGFTIFVVLLLAGLFINARLKQVNPVRQNLIILVPLLFFAIMLAIRSDWNLIALNVAEGILAALLLVYFFASERLLQQDIFGYGLKSIASAFSVLVQPFAEWLDTIKWFRTHRFGWKALMPFIRGLIITVPIVAIFVLLLSSADTVFADYVGNILKSLAIPNMDALVSPTLLLAVLAWSAIGGMGFALMDHRRQSVPVHQVTASTELDDLIPQEAQQLPVKKPSSSFRLGFTETTMLLGSVSAVFAAFVLIQFVYLFGGVKNITSAKFSYADYVHRGFAELVIVGILTLGLAYLLKAGSARNMPSHEMIFRILVTLLMALTGIILVSAFQRLRLYEEAYGVTTLRLAVYVFIVWLGVLLAGFTLSLYWQPKAINAFGVTALLAVFGFAATLDLINPDAFVAREMIDRGDVDPAYLASLSSEAVPAMASLLDSPEPGTRAIMQGAIKRQFYSISSITVNANWRDFSVGRSAALAVFDTLKDKIPTFSGAAGVITHSLSDFDSLKKGMTYRQIIRQFGYANSNYSVVDDEPDGFYLTYPINGDNKHRVSLYIDPTTGLDQACERVVDTYGQGVCKPMTLP